MECKNWQILKVSQNRHFKWVRCRNFQLLSHQRWENTQYFSTTRDRRFSPILITRSGTPQSCFGMIDKNTFDVKTKRSLNFSNSNTNKKKWHFNELLLNIQNTTLCKNMECLSNIIPVCKFSFKRSNITVVTFPNISKVQYSVFIKGHWDESAYCLWLRHFERHISHIGLFIFINHIIMPVVSLLSMLFGLPNADKQKERGV